MHPKRIHIVGPKNSGKTTLIEFLVGELTARGLKVGTMKHSSHSHSLDRPGSDSDRHRRAGANPAAFFTSEGMTLVVSDSGDELLDEIQQTAYARCDVVLVESQRRAPSPKIVLAEPDDLLDDLQNVVAVVNSEGLHQKYPAFLPFDKKLVRFLIQFLAGRE